MIDPQLRDRTQVVVNCNYFARDANHVEVVLVYALPSDLNPLNDFDLGCSSAETKWTASDRVFSVMSPDQWAIATLKDFLGELSDSDVPAFENVTRQLLRNAEGYAHVCTLKIRPTELTSTFTFAFRSVAGTGSGSFKTTGVSNNSGAIPVVEVSTHNIALTMKKHKITFKVTHGIRFYPSQKPKLVLAVQILSSQMPSCGSGNTGTLILTTRTLLLRACNQSFSGGKTTAQIVLF